MVSARFKAIYEAQGMKGVTTFHPAATIVKLGNQKKGTLPAQLPIYHLIEVAWNAANLDDVASKVVRKGNGCDFCRGALRKYDGIFLEKESWDGSDIFKARGLPRVILISERFKQLAEAHNLKQILLIPAEDYIYNEDETPHYSIRKNSI